MNNWKTVVLAVMMTWGFCQQAFCQLMPRPKVGLVLGGGGAKGAAEVGVLKVIEEAGIPIDYIAGTSIGSIVGGLYAIGYRAEQLDSLFTSQEWLTLLSDRQERHRNKIYQEQDSVGYVFGFPVIRKGKKHGDESFGMVKGDKILQLLQEKTGSYDALPFDSLPIPFRCVAVDLNKWREVVLQGGSLARAMRASMAIPGVFKALRSNDRLLVDGGVLNNLPVDVVRKMGADIVIAIDLTQKKHASRDFSLKDWVGIGGAVDWLVSRPDITKYNKNRQDADVYINPPLEGYDVASFNNASIREMIHIGQRTGKKHWNDLLKVKEMVEKRNFSTR